ncbi:MAG: VWA domain-containing protein, partial [Candidatus Heimdallarchaeota archaeon]|nr:VWA domain-containing protein [Candidatus Heimdallarchaeota archaeon]
MPASVSGIKNTTTSPIISESSSQQQVLIYKEELPLKFSILTLPDPCLGKGIVALSSIERGTDGVILKIEDKPCEECEKQFYSKLTIDSEDDLRDEYIKWRAVRYTEIVNESSTKIKQQDPNVTIVMYADDINSLTSDLKIVISEGDSIKTSESYKFVFEQIKEITKSLDYVIIEKGGKQQLVEPAVVTFAAVIGALTALLISAYIAAFIVDILHSCLGIDLPEWLVSILMALVGNITNLLLTVIQLVAGLICGGFYDLLGIDILPLDDYLDSKIEQTKELQTASPEVVNEFLKQEAYFCSIYPLLCGAAWTCVVARLTIDKVNEVMADVVEDTRTHFEHQLPLLGISWEISDSELDIGDTATVTYTISADSEWGPGYNIHIEDTLPEGVKLLSGDTSDTFDISPGETKVLSYIVEATECGTFMIKRNDITYVCKISASETFSYKWKDKGGNNFVVTVCPIKFTPLDLCMVLDRSGSMNEYMVDKTKIQGVKEAATGVVNVLFLHDRVSMVSFSDTATTDIYFTSDFSAVKTKINQLSAGGGTSFGAGLKLALDQFNAHGNPDHIPAILFMSDGKHWKSPDPGAYVAE